MRGRRPPTTIRRCVIEARDAPPRRRRRCPARRRAQARPQAGAQALSLPSTPRRRAPARTCRARAEEGPSRRQLRQRRGLRPRNPFAQIQPHRQHDHRHARVLEPPLDLKRRLVVEHAPEARVLVEDELPGDEERLRVLPDQLEARASRPRRRPRCPSRARLGGEAERRRERVVLARAPRCVRFSSSWTSPMPLKLPESTTATEQNTTPLKCPGNMRSSVSSAWRPRPP